MSDFDPFDPFHDASEDGVEDSGAVIDSDAVDPTAPENGSAASLADNASTTATASEVVDGAAEPFNVLSDGYGPKPERRRALSPVHHLPMEQAMKYFTAAWEQGWASIAEMAKRDRFFLLTMVLGRKDACDPWLYARCREVEADPDEHLDLWAREHYKSTIITFAGIIQEVINDPEITIGIFSFNKSAAKKFLNQIKMEFEGNDDLKRAFPHIFWEKPDREAPTWSLDTGIVVKRQNNPKEKTIEANGLIDGMPTGAHYMLRVYDDVVTRDSVTNPDMLAKVKETWELSLNLGARGGTQWYIGTIYHFNDTYRTMMDRKSVRPRIHPCTDDGTLTGEPVFLTKEEVRKKRRDMGPYVFAAQMLLNPVADERQGFKEEWMRYYPEGVDLHGYNAYILVDPASAKKKTSDYTAMFVIGLFADRNYRVLDIVRDRMNLKERGDMLFSLHRKWKPLGVGYEKYGKDSDIEHYEERMKLEQYHFTITELGGAMAKEDRIRKLVPVFEQGRMWFPEVLYREDYEGRKVELVRVFVEQELKGFPVAIHDDMMDCLARIRDPKFSTLWPKADAGAYGNHQGRRRYDHPRRINHGRTHMSN